MAQLGHTTSLLTDPIVLLHHKRVLKQAAAVLAVSVFISKGLLTCFFDDGQSLLCIHKNIFIFV